MHFHLCYKGKFTQFPRVSSKVLFRRVWESISPIPILEQDFPLVLEKRERKRDRETEREKKEGQEADFFLFAAV